MKEKGNTLTNHHEVEPLLPTLALPDVVGLPLNPAELAAVAQQSFADMAKALQCERLIALAYLPAENLLRGVRVVGLDSALLPELQWSPDACPAFENALQTRAPALLPDAASLPRPLAQHLTGPILILPLSLGNRVLSLLIGQSSAEVNPQKEYWDTHLRLLSERAALLVEMERIALAYQNELRLRYSTREITASILQGSLQNEIAESITAIIAQILSVERVALYLRDKTGAPYPVHLRAINAEESLHIMLALARTLRNAAPGQPSCLRNIQQEPSLTFEQRMCFQEADFTTVLVTPLHFADRVDGALALFPAQEREFTPTELSVFQSFADMATLGVAMAHQIEQERAVAMSEERNRLAREMHDTVAQSLVALSLQIETAQAALQSGNAPATIELLASARAIARKALEDTRRAVLGLGPLALESLTAAQAISEEVRRLEVEKEIPAQFVLTGEEQPLTPDQRIALLRIAQEALTNICKHAQARRVRVGLQFSTEEVVLIVEDDGVGFDVAACAAPGPEGGYGLFGMMERARLAGGELKIESTLHWGTRIVVNLPYRLASPLPPLQEPRPSQPATPPPAPPVADAVRVLIADDHAVTRQGLRTMLEQSKQVVVVGEASDGAEAAVNALALRPDVVLMDVQMPGVDGLEGLRRIHAQQADLPVVILTTFLTDETVREALRAGARGYLLKDACAEDLIAAVRAAARGETALSPVVTERLAELAQGRRTEEREVLNERAMEVLQLLAQGARNKEIAAKLFLSERTVEYHLSTIFTRLGVSNRTEAVRAAIERGLLS
jgi:DNA-binding NarL/FixJ family response regulator/signal transduction histidine kinase